MTVKEYLKQAFTLEVRIRTMEKELENLSSLAEKCTANYENDGSSSGTKANTAEKAIDNIISYREQINTEIDKLVDLRKDITAKIKTVHSTEYQTVLYKRYVQLEKWEQIAVDMDYSIRQVYNLHGEALLQVKM